jgi:hypothetical protein
MLSNATTHAVPRVRMETIRDSGGGFYPYFAPVRYYEQRLVRDDLPIRPDRVAWAIRSRCRRSCASTSGRCAVPRESRRAVGLLVAPRPRW